MVEFHMRRVKRIHIFIIILIIAISILLIIFLQSYQIVSRDYIESKAEEARNRYIASIISYSAGSLDAYSSQLYIAASAIYEELAIGKNSSLTRLLYLCDYLAGKVNETYIEFRDRISINTDFFRKYISIAGEKVRELLDSYGTFRRAIEKGDLSEARRALSTMNRAMNELRGALSSIESPLPLK
jgi:hypothetical protein